MGSIEHGITLSGINPTKSYPCKSGVKKAVTVTGHVHLNGEESMASHVCNNGPISVAIDTHGWGDTYSGGVLSPNSCGTSTSHDVLIVGLAKSDKAWIVQNSWGSDWGVAFDGSSLASKGEHRDFLHGKYCVHLVEQGCSKTMVDAIDAINKVSNFDVKGNWQKNQKTVADECPRSCAALNEKGGYVYMEFGKNTCGITNEPIVPTATA